VATIHGFSSEQIVPVFEKYNGSGYYHDRDEIGDRHRARAGQRRSQIG
jgi:hypothetical protein